MKLPWLPAVSGLAPGWPEILTLLLAGAATGFRSGMMGVGGLPLRVGVLRGTVLPGSDPGKNRAFRPGKPALRMPQPRN